MIPVVHCDVTSMSIHFRSLITLMEKPGVSLSAKRDILLEIAETLLLNTELKFPSRFIRTLIDKIETDGSFDRMYIGRLWRLV